MTKANGKCNRCSGTGTRNCARTHHGVPGLCFDCNGSGLYADQAASKATRRDVKQIEDRRREATQPLYDKIWAVRHAAASLGFPSPTYDQRRWFMTAGVFSTCDFAKAFGLSKLDAWNLLCCSYPKIGLYYDETANAVLGWAAEYNA